MRDHTMKIHSEEERKICSSYRQAYKLHSNGRWAVNFIIQLSLYLHTLYNGPFCRIFFTAVRLKLSCVFILLILILEIFGPRRDKVIGESRRLHIEKLFEILFKLPT